jgi:hypothetical protein
MTIDRNAKVAAFCRELGKDTLRNIASKNGQEEVFQDAVDLLKADQIGQDLEDKLDVLDKTATRAVDKGLYPADTRRSFEPLPGSGRDTGARWWTCPHGWCSGRGLVRRGQAPEVCLAAGAPGEQLVQEPLPG